MEAILLLVPLTPVLLWHGWSFSCEAWRAWTEVVAKETLRAQEDVKRKAVLAVSRLMEAAAPYDARHAGAHVRL